MPLSSVLAFESSQLGLKVPTFVNQRVLLRIVGEFGKRLLQLTEASLSHALVFKHVIDDIQQHSKLGQSLESL
jgi:hypothetical protein